MLNIYCREGWESNPEEGRESRPEFPAKFSAIDWTGLTYAELGSVLPIKPFKAPLQTFHLSSCFLRYNSGRQAVDVGLLQSTILAYQETLQDVHFSFSDENYVRASGQGLQDHAVHKLVAMKRFRLENMVTGQAALLFECFKFPAVELLRVDLVGSEKDPLALYRAVDALGERQLCSATDQVHCLRG